MTCDVVDSFETRTPGFICYERKRKCFANDHSSFGSLCHVSPGRLIILHNLAAYEKCFKRWSDEENHFNRCSGMLTHILGL